MIETILERMTLREKIEQLNQIMYLVDDFDKLKERIKKECIGSVILATGCLAGCTEQETMFVDKLNELQETSMKYHNIPLMFGRDVIHGHNVVWPIPLAMSATFNPDMIKKSYEYITEEANADGVNWFFSPMIDLARDPRWGRIVEGPGEDPYLGAKMAEAAVKGIQGEGEYIKTAACAKHFVGYGASEGGRDYHRAEISDYSLRNYYLKSFDMAVKSGVATVMNSFNEISGEPTTSSKYLLGDVLRGEMGFEGFVISDWG
ncbi:MAG: glycoside hydrolase family 3 N-terminal domain-containing protein, partial [Clostridia bacterium]|nr:glycoside hydrolase family 3 N-terminal domain-containing protein [Clostridia bacterium]